MREENRGTERREASLILNSCSFHFLPNPKDFDYFTVDMEKGAKGFGFSIRGGREYQNGFVCAEISRRWASNKEWKDEGKSFLFIKLLNSERSTYCGIDAVLKPTIKQTDLIYMLPSFHFTVQYSKGLAKHCLRLISHFFLMSSN